MFGIDLSWQTALVAFVFFAAFVALLVCRKRLFTYADKKALPVNTIQRYLRPFIVFLCIPAGFLLVELPYNTQLFEMEPSFVLLNCAIIAVLCAFIYSLGQRTKTSLVVFLLICFVIGVANHFVALFKGQPILPSDVVALQTAAAVGAGYTYVIDDAIMNAWIIFEILACLLTLIPSARLSKRSILVNSILAALIGLCSYAWYATVDIEKDYDCSVDVWSSLNSYREHGALLCFLQRAQQLTPQQPEGYSSEEAYNLRSGTSTTYNDEILSTANLTEQAQALAPQVQPSIIVIMNETFSDISLYSTIDDSYEGIPLFRSLCDEALLSGNAYVSALGGGTCNSEFEFLTGSSTGLLGAGVYPYMLYDLQDVDNVAEYLSSAGYKTSAIHPANASNWRRDRVYEQLGFETFYDITSFENAETRRGLVTDAATYDLVLDLLSKDDTPQFIFDVTIANHSGYETGELSEEETITTLVNGEDDAAVDEYISCIRHSDIEFYEFINALKNLDRPVIVCMFGDHQPEFADELAEASTGISLSDFDIEQTQMRYQTPYIIWTNSDELKHVNKRNQTYDLSLNYLGAHVLKASGLSLDEYFAFLLSLEQEIPAINLNGYEDASGTWYWQGEESEVSQARKELAIVQHNNLFDKDN